MYTDLLRIGALGFSPATTAILQSRKISTVTDLIRCPEEELLGLASITDSELRLVLSARRKWILKTAFAEHQKKSGSAPEPAETAAETTADPAASPESKADEPAAQAAETAAETFSADPAASPESKAEEPSAQEVPTASGEVLAVKLTDLGFPVQFTDLLADSRLTSLEDFSRCARETPQFFARVMIHALDTMAKELKSKRKAEVPAPAPKAAPPSPVRQEAPVLPASPEPAADKPPVQSRAPEKSSEPTIPEAYASISIDTLHISGLSRRRLHSCQLHTVKDFLLQSEQQLQRLPYLGVVEQQELLKLRSDLLSGRIKLTTAPAAEPERVSPAEASVPAGEALPAEEAASPAKASPSRKDTADFDFASWLITPEGMGFVVRYLEERQIKISDIDNLPALYLNLLSMGGYTYLHQIIFLRVGDLLRLPHMRESNAKHLMAICRQYLLKHQDEIVAAWREAAPSGQPDGGLPSAHEPEPEELFQVPDSELSIFELIHRPQLHANVLAYVQMNDLPLQRAPLSAHTRKSLEAHGFANLSDLIFMTRAELAELPTLDTASVQELFSCIRDYLDTNEASLRAYLGGNEDALVSDASLEALILHLYQPLGFVGLSWADFQEQLQLTGLVSEQRLKAAIGRLLAGKKLEYVDYRCYPVYESFADAAAACPRLSELDRSVLQSRLGGISAEQTERYYSLPFGRVRQLSERAATAVRDWHLAETGSKWFDEDYYRYFYSTYAFDPDDAAACLHIPARAFQYFDILGIEQGDKPLSAALEDRWTLGVGLRLAIQRYLNRDKLYIDGRWVEKDFSVLGRIAAERLCRESLPYDDFAAGFNRFLEELDVPRQDALYCTPANRLARDKVISESGFVLCSRNDCFRYYDIDERDYGELLDTLELDSYENIELSTAKFTEDFPELMDRYDIRSPYELHNLLRKIVPAGSYHDFCPGKMPTLRFGEFDRSQAALALISEHSPISSADLVRLIHEEYGFDEASIPSSWLSSLREYDHNGIYSVDQRAMSAENMSRFQAALQDDFYYISELQQLYADCIPGASPDELNPASLSKLGFVVLSKYAVRNYRSLDAYFTDLLTRKDIVDIAGYRKRFTGIMMFSTVLKRLKANLQIVEFSPNVFISLRKLEASGITREAISDFCNDVYDFVEDGTYFNAGSIQKQGFSSALLEFGFEDHFYSNLLLSDSRFSYATMFGSLILYKGDARITIKSFLSKLVEDDGPVDVYDLCTDLSEIYGCRTVDRNELLQKIQGSQLYHDHMLDKLYANVDLYYQELDEMEDI